MSSAVPEVDPATAFSPTTPICVRSRSSLHPLSGHSPHAMSHSPYARSPQKPLWPQESVPPSLSIPSFPVDPALNGADTYPMDDHRVDGDHSQAGYIPSSTSASAMPMSVPPQFHQSATTPMPLLSDYDQFDGLRMDPRLMQRTHSVPATYRAPGSQFLYYHQITGPDRHPIAWSTREVALRSPPAPRQRSAKACKKCRKRKTKCSGGYPCARCVTRGLECEYDEKSTLRGPMKGRTQLPLMPGKSTSSDGSRSSSRSGHRHQPYPTRSPSRPPSAHATDNGSSQGMPMTAPQMSQQSMLQLLGMNSGDMQTQENAGYPAYSVPPAPDAFMPQNGMEMSTMVDNATVQMATGGYHLMPVVQQGDSMGWNWDSRVTGEEGDSSDSSRPASACSGSSFSSTDGTYVINKLGVVWPSSVSDHFHTTIPSPLSASSSSSSLKDALVEVPRPRRPSAPAPAHTPISPSVASRRDPTSAEFAATLTKILHNASIAEPSPDEGAALPPSPSNSAPALSASPPDSGTTWSSPITPSSPLELQFEDVFNLSPSTSGISPSTSMASVASSPAWQTRSPESTIRAKSELVQNSRASARVLNDTTRGVGTPSLDLKTPRAMQIFRFDGDTTRSPPGLTSHLQQA